MAKSFFFYSSHLYFTTSVVKDEKLRYVHLFWHSRSPLWQLKIRRVYKMEVHQDNGLVKKGLEGALNMKPYLIKRSQLAQIAVGNYLNACQAAQKTRFERVNTFRRIDNEFSIVMSMYCWLGERKRELNEAEES